MLADLAGRAFTPLDQSDTASSRECREMDEEDFNAKSIHAEGFRSVPGRGRRMYGHGSDVNAQTDAFFVGKSTPFQCTTVTRGRGSLERVGGLLGDVA